MRCSLFFPEDRLGNADVGCHTRGLAWETVTVPMMAGGHHIYLVGTLLIPHIKNTDKVKKRSPPLRMHSDGQPFSKAKFSYSLRQYCY